MINRAYAGSRCRVVRAVHHPSGAIDRHTHGTIRYAMENIGRELVLVDWDTGKTTMVFPDDIELVESPAEALA